MTLIELTERASSIIGAYRSERTDERLFVSIVVHPKRPVEQRYELEFVDQSSYDRADVAAVIDGIGFCCDSKSAQILDGTVIDYVEGMWSSGFSFQNPNRHMFISDPRAAEVERVLSDCIAPILREHKGTVELVDVCADEVRVAFGGGCKGCGMASATLREVVERELCARFTDISRVVDVTSHAEDRRCKGVPGLPDRELPPRARGPASLSATARSSAT